MMMIFKSVLLSSFVTTSFLCCSAFTPRYTNRPSYLPATATSRTSPPPHSTTSTPSFISSCTALASATTSSTEDTNNPNTDANANANPSPKAPTRPSEGMEITHTEPEDVIIHIAPKAMIRLQELQQQSGKEIVLRMGVRNGGCSGLSYVMDFSSREEIQEDDAVDEYPKENIVCVVDAKSMLYLYGLELDYSDALIGGGFKFFNPNAEESCGCGSSFGV